MFSNPDLLFQYSTDHLRELRADADRHRLRKTAHGARRQRRAAMRHRA